jgi:phage-related protein (TIGR01555 family)
VHESRILRFDGTQVPLKERIRNRYWNHSYLQFVFDRVRGLGSAYSDIEHILNEFIMGSLSIDDFLGLVATGQDKLIQDRLNLFDMTKSVHNTAIFQKGEEYKRESATVSGLGDLVDKLTQAVSFVTGIPESILFGKSISGINTSSDMNIRRYYDKIKADAARILTKPMQKLVKYDMLAKKSRFKGHPLAEWSLDFPYPWELSEVETADLRNKQANTDKVYIDGGVVTPEEVAASRFAGDHYSIETKLLTDRSDPGYTELVEGRTASAEEKAAAAMESQRLALEAQAAKQQEGPTGKQEGATNEKDE